MKENLMHLVTDTLKHLNNKIVEIFMQSLNFFQKSSLMAN